jgi:protein required for attachment to host cells
MYTTWILVANRSGARLFENRGPGRDLTLIETIYHPEGMLQNREIETERRGRANQSSGRMVHNTYDTNLDATDHLAEVFAKHLAVHLDEARRKNAFSKLILVAEARFLGKLKGALSKQTDELIHMTLSKDLPTASASALLLRLGDAEGLWSDVHRHDQERPSTRVGER